jgi:hypothetical protein
VEKRRKKLSKAVYGTSHIVSLDEAKYIYEEGAERVILGTGQQGMVKLSTEAIQAWNEAEGAVIGLFHVTC